MKRRVISWGWFAAFGSVAEHVRRELDCREPPLRRRRLAQRGTCSPPDVLTVLYVTVLCVTVLYAMTVLALTVFDILALTVLTVYMSWP